jgi:hypothetical protein
MTHLNFLRDSLERENKLVSSLFFSISELQNYWCWGWDRVSGWWHSVLIMTASRYSAFSKTTARVQTELDGFGGLVVSMLASGIPSSRVQPRPKPLDFSSVVKILKHAFLRRGSKNVSHVPALRHVKRT